MLELHSTNMAAYTINLCRDVMWKHTIEGMKQISRDFLKCFLTIRVIFLWLFFKAQSMFSYMNKPSHSQKGTDQSNLCDLWQRTFLAVFARCVP
jgi:Sec-independent protein secretion pathway component TatC